MQKKQKRKKKKQKKEEEAKRTYEEELEEQLTEEEITGFQLEKTDMDKMCNRFVKLLLIMNQMEYFKVNFGKNSNFQAEMVLV